MQSTLLAEAPTKTKSKKQTNKKTYIDLDAITLVPQKYEAWRRTEYIERLKMYKRFKDLELSEYTEPQLCIIEEAETGEKFYIVFVAARDFKTRLQITEDDWCFGKVEEEAIGSYYKDSIHNFKVFAASKEQAHHILYKECVKNNLRMPKLWQIKKVDK